MESVFSVHLKLVSKTCSNIVASRIQAAHCLTTLTLLCGTLRQLAYSDTKRDFASRGTSPSLLGATGYVIPFCAPYTIALMRISSVVTHLLGYLYLMQLRYKDGHFATRPNSAWRLVFVLALMPWLHKYRQLAMLDYLGQEDGDEEQCFRHNMRRSAMLSNDSRSLLNCLSHHSMGKRRGLSAFDTNEEDIERTNRISQIQAELESLQNELRELQDQEDDDSC